MGFYEGIGLQQEYDIINKHLGVEEIDPYKDTKKYKKFLMEQLDESIEKQSNMSKNMLKVSLEIYEFFLNRMQSNPNKLMEIINSHEYQLIKTNQEIQFRRIQTDRKAERCNDYLDKVELINSVTKEFQDLTESVSKKLSILIEIANIEKNFFDKKDIKKATLYEKIIGLKKFKELDFSLNLINRKIRNKIGHFEMFFDVNTRIFKDSNGKLICSYEEFKKYMLSIGAFEMGFMQSLNYLALISLKEYDFLKEYIEKAIRDMIYV